MVMRNRAVLVVVASLIVAPLAGAHAEESGIASIYMYGKPVRTASGERTNDAGLNAAHKSLPFGTMVKVTNRRNGHSVVVKIIDRGPFVRGRVIDVTPAAAKALGFWGAGVTPVTLSVVGRG
jgi:peptidoglycan lytic transglycosylase